MLSTFVGACVVTVGTADVVNDDTALNDVPVLLLAMPQKKYVMPGNKPVTACVYGDVVVDAGAIVPPVAGARVPNASLHAPGSAVAIRKYAVVSAPPGFTVPFNDAPRDVTFVALVDVTTGAAGSVVNDDTVPTDVPMALLASAQ
jgi:hypothetical protein